MSTPSIKVGHTDRTGVERIAIGDRRSAKAAAPNNVVRGVDDAVAVVVTSEERRDIGSNLQQTSSQQHRACELSARARGSPRADWLRNAIEKQGIDYIGATAKIQL